jgi:hypothetical protein
LIADELPSGRFEQSNGPEKIANAYRAYTYYLESVRPVLPDSAYQFAAAPWHYDYADHRCPHDSWVQTLTISEPASGTPRHVRHVEIAIRLLGAFHDGYLELSYSGVRHYSLSGASGISKNEGHGDWVTDEISLSERNLVCHQVLLRNRSRWMIESTDIHVRWIPS